MGPLIFWDSLGSSVPSSVTDLPYDLGKVSVYKDKYKVKLWKQDLTEIKWRTEMGAGGIAI